MLTEVERYRMPGGRVDSHRAVEIVTISAVPIRSVAGSTAITCAVNLAARFIIVQNTVARCKHGG